MNRIVMDMLKPINTAAIMIMGVFTAIWGLWVLSPFWHVFTRAPVYHYMDIFPEWMWGVFATLVGVTIIMGVAKRTYKSLTYGALFGFFHWIIVATFFFCGDWQNTGWITYLMISLYCGFIWLNLRVNSK